MQVVKSVTVQVISYSWFVTGEVALTVNVPVEPAGIAAATFNANSQLVVSPAATPSLHDFAPGGGKAKLVTKVGVPVGSGVVE